MIDEKPTTFDVWVRAKDMPDKPPVPLIEDPVRILRGSRVVISGPPNLGKTWICLALAVGVALAGEPVAFLAAEGFATLGTRVRRVLRGLGCIDELERLPLDFINPRNESIAAFAAARARRFALVVVDPLSSWYPGDENAAHEMRGWLNQAIDPLIDRESAVLLVHHDAKKGGPRGSTVLPAWADTMVQLGGKPPPIASCEKERELERFPSRRIEITHSGDETRVTSATGAASKTRVSGPAPLERLRAALDAGPATGMNISELMKALSWSATGVRTVLAQAAEITCSHADRMQRGARFCLPRDSDA